MRRPARTGSPGPSGTDRIPHPSRAPRSLRLRGAPAGGDPGSGRRSRRHAPASPVHHRLTCANRLRTFILGAVACRLRMSLRGLSWRAWNEPPCPTHPRSCSSACTTQDAVRWRLRCSSSTLPAGSGSGRPARSPPTVSTPRWCKRWRRSGSTSRPSGRSSFKMRSCAMRTSSSRWGAGTRARSSPASGTRTGSSRIPPASLSWRSALIRDEIDGRVRALLEELTGQAESADRSEASGSGRTLK